MSSFFDEASLVFIPSGYKTSKAYSVKPTSGDGDLAFTRSNDTATRVGPDGLIEKVRTNLVLQSNTFSNASWSKIGATLTAGQSDPNGGSNAFKLELAAGANNYLYQSIASIPAGEKTISCWMRADSAISVSFGAGGATPNQVTLTTSWVRYSFTTTDTTGGVFFGNYFPVIGQPALTFYVFQSQYEMGVMTDYIATTTAAVSVGPVANVPRLDYLNSSCPRLLLEPQRTNLITYSEQFNNAIWNKDNTTLTSGFVSPSGYANAFKLIEQATNAVHSIYQSFPSLSSSVYSATAFVKKGERFKCSLADRNTGAYVSFNLNTGTIIASGTFTGKIEAYGNDWYRVTVTSASALTVIVPQIFVLPDSYTTGLPITLPYVGDGTSGIYIWGAQLEAGSYATSYIPTLGAAVTRGADAASKTGISSLIGSTEGTVFFDWIMVRESQSASEDYYPITISDGTSANMVTLNNYNNSLLAYVSSGGSAVFTNSSFSGSSGLRIKAAIAYKANDFAFYVNGVQIATDTSGAAPIGLSQLNVNTYFSGVYIDDTKVNQLLLFPTRLSNSDLAALTA